MCRNHECKSVDTNFDAQTALRKDEIGNMPNAKSHSALVDGRKGSQDTPSAGQTDRGPLSPAHFDLDGNKVISSDEGNQEQVCSMPFAGGSATDVQQSKPQCFSAASSNSKALTDNARWLDQERTIQAQYSTISSLPHGFEEFRRRSDNFAPGSTN